ncbi:uncharacterized protein LOC111612728 [Centruroides sculpturatus]|uniref:uncharacterized protein LOC111612728 n=1 Tax=Centruroides sculpturatus TaxID=218467 RepID=UPI000C6E79BD|nr:uncharacterized protein LOC111612728 [Centruroides sculpturatus]
MVSSFYAKIAIIFLISGIGLSEGAPVTPFQQAKPMWQKWKKPLNRLLEEAQQKPFMMDAIRNELRQSGFKDEEIDDLIKNGISSLKGKKISLDDVSMFCCTL